MRVTVESYRLMMSTPVMQHGKLMADMNMKLMMSVIWKHIHYGLTMNKTNNMKMRLIMGMS